MKIVFFGTPEFSVPSLQALLAGRHQVVAVVTQPDRPKGRTRNPVSGPIKIAAENAGIPVFQPTNLKEEAFLENLRQFRAEGAVVVAYGRLLPQKLLQCFPKGVVNLHASLLPKFRGAAPIQWALINGETVTGVTVFRLDEQLDHGPTLLQASHPIAPEDTAATLAQDLSALGAETLCQTLDKMEQGTLTSRPQQETEATLAPLLRKEDGILDWTKSCQEIHNRVRGLQPWPGAMTWLGGTLLKIASTHPDPSRKTSSAPAGTVVTSDIKEGLWVQTGQGQIRIDQLQLAGGTLQDAASFLRGHRLSVGTHLSDQANS